MHKQRTILLTAVILAVGFVWLRGGFVGLGDRSVVAAAPAQLTEAQREQGLDVAIFASGCFWCTEADFDKVDGVVSTTSGYTGGHVVDPTYRQVSSGGTGHAEAVQVVYDTNVVRYEELLDTYWHNVDPFVADRQFCDTGDQYRPEIFVLNAAQRKAAEASKVRMQARFSQPIVVQITDAEPFYRAEDYHQDYYLKNSAQYRFYRFGCGRDRRLEQIWEQAAG